MIKNIPARKTTMYGKYCAKKTITWSIKTDWWAKL
jgi:hypothetical protein